MTIKVVSLNSVISFGFDFNAISISNIYWSFYRKGNLVFPETNPIEIADLGL
jgi:hypothetical protein